MLFVETCSKEQDLLEHWHINVQQDYHEDDESDHTETVKINTSKDRNTNYHMVTPKLGPLMLNTLKENPTPVHKEDEKQRKTLDTRKNEKPKKTGFSNVSSQFQLKPRIMTHSNDPPTEKFKSGFLKKRHSKPTVLLREKTIISTKNIDLVPVNTFSTYRIRYGTLEFGDHAVRVVPTTVQTILPSTTKKKGKCHAQAQKSKIQVCIA